MSWIEVIHLRSTARETEQLVHMVQQLAEEAIKEDCSRKIQLWRSTRVDTDFSIVLSHDTIEIAPKGSVLGLCIADALKEYGMVNHMTWHEIHPSREPVGEK